MTINMDWKYKAWISALVLMAVGVVLLLSYQAVIDSGNYFGTRLVNELVSFK